MDALICRVALLLSCAPSAVARMQATDVLVTAYAETQRQKETAMSSDLTAIRDAALVNLAMWAPEKLKDEEQKVRDRAGLTPKAMGLTPEMEAVLAALPLETP